MLPSKTTRDFSYYALLVCWMIAENAEETGEMWRFEGVLVKLS
jgi:hypothetical protein